MPLFERLHAHKIVLHMSNYLRLIQVTTELHKESLRQWGKILMSQCQGRVVILVEANLGGITLQVTWIKG